jgi:hypothetical protein
MLKLPQALARDWRLATAAEVHSWSFGQVRAKRRHDAFNWEDRLFTLDDQSIFGPARDFQCACGKYEGEQYRGMICDRCGVKLTSRSARRERFGHIDLPSGIPHPLGDEADLVEAVPVLPATFMDCAGGKRLAAAYEDLVEAAASESRDDMAARLVGIVSILLPVATMTQEWAMEEASVFARGLVMIYRTNPEWRE